MTRWHPITIEQLDPDARVTHGEPTRTGRYLVTVRGKACDHIEIETFFDESGWDRIDPESILAWATLPRPYESGDKKHG